MIEKIDLEWLKTFVTFAECAGVDEAAAKLKVTQPAITQHLNKLEAFLPRKLFSKQGKRKVLTEFGWEFYKNCSQYLKNIDELLRNSKFLNVDPRDVIIRMGMNREIFYRISNKIKFDGQLDIYNQRSGDAIKSLLKREIDVAVSRVAPDSTDIIAVKWFSDNFVLAFPKEWMRLVDKKGLKETIIEKNMLFNVDSESQVELALNYLGIDFNKTIISHRLRDWFVTIKLIESGGGWGIIPNSFSIDSKVTTIPVLHKHLPKTQFYIIYHRSVRNYPGFKELIESMLSAIT